MAREGTPVNIGIDKGLARGLRSNVARNTAIAVALLTAVAGTGVIISQKGGGGPSPETPPATPIGVVVPPRSETPPPTIAPPEKPTPSPTEKVLTDTEKIDLARNAHKNALAKGEYRIPISEKLISIGGGMEEGKLLPNGERDLFVVIPSNIDFVLPSNVDGKVIDVAKVGPAINMVSILADGKNVVFISTGVPMVKIGDTMSMGDPLFSVKYDPESAQQKTFEERGSEVKPKGTVAIIGLQDPNAGAGKGFEQMSIEKNLLKDSTGKLLSIPTLKK